MVWTRVVNYKSKIIKQDKLFNFILIKCVHLSSSDLYPQAKTSLNLNSTHQDPKIYGALPKILASKNPLFSIFYHNQSCDTIYNLPSPMKKKGMGIGYGNKSDFTKDLTSSPAATRYRLDTVFDKNRKSKRGFSIYESREVRLFL